MALNDPISSASLAPTLEALLVRAKQYGADKADAIATHGRSLAITTRNGELEDVDNSEGRDIGLRVLVGQRQASVSSSDLSAHSIDQLAERAVAMAKLAPEDPYCGLAPHDRLSTEDIALDLFDSTEMSPQMLKARALELEKAAYSVEGINQAEGATANQGSSAIYFMTSDGFSKGWRSSRHGLSITALAGQGDTMQRDYDYDSARWLSDLKSAEDIGKKAAERTLAKMGGKQMPSAALPVIFDRRVSKSLISAFLGGINGAAVSRGISFLKDKLGEPIFSDSINIIDDPLIMRGAASRPWDGEGVSVSRQNLVKNGILQSWLLNCSAAKQLGLETNGHASRGIGYPPGISSTNCYLQPGEKTHEMLMRDMGHGLVITEMFGPSLNSNTGDYSVGVTGYAVENGERSYPVNEITVAGNLIEIFKTLIPANNLILDSGTSAPSILTEGLTIAGS